MDNKLLNRNIIIMLLFIYLILFLTFIDNLTFCRNYIYPEFSDKMYSKFHDNKFSIYINNNNTIYSLKQFYKKFPDFDYYKYRQSKQNLFKNKGELYVVTYWYNNDGSYDFLNQTNFNINNTKNIIIYPHLPFNLSDGGTTVLYYLASLLDKLGIKVRIHRRNGVNNLNPIYVNYYDNDFDLNNTVVIYCEGTIGNPLNAPYTVRWILSELGKNVPLDFANTWKKNELVYYFNSELKFNQYPEKLGSIYKLLTTIYVNPDIKTYNFDERYGYCYTMRKSYLYHPNINVLHPDGSFEITKTHTQEEYIKIFNKCKYFISYDPLTFLNIIASLCGCISIVYPIEGVTKKEWLQMGAFSEYLKEKGNYNLNGIAYGNSAEELKFAESTIHLVKDQWDDIKNYEHKLIENFINDINNFNKMENTLQNNYF